MALMSSGAREPGRRRLLDILVRIAVPSAAVVAFAAIVTSSARELDEDLHLIAPDALAAGALLPVRARLYSGLKRPEGARLITPAIELELRDTAGHRLSHGRLARAFGDSLQAMLAVPAAYRGEARLSARVARPPQTRSELVLRIGDSVESTALPLEPRALSPLQQFASGPVVARNPEQAAPDVMALAIRGGACVPELPCALFVQVGAPGAALRALASPSVTPDPASARASALTEGIVPLRVMTHGPEAELVIVAERDGHEVARRAFRLAVALGASSARELTPLLEAGATPSLGLEGAEAGCLVDGFRERRWLRAGSLASCHADEALPFAALEPGLWRLQLRRDAFASNGAAVISVYVRAPGETTANVLAQLVTALAARSPEDTSAARLARDPNLAGGELSATANYLLARLDDGIVELPAPVSGYRAALLELSAERAKVRKLALVAIVLCALTLGSLVAQRGLSAAAQASQLMADVGEDPKRLARQRVRMLLRVFSTVTTLLLAFVVIALYVVLRTQPR